ncbi:MAG: apolipoprotein N-acyltransferase [Pseudomonadota bacterium]
MSVEPRAAPVADGTDATWRDASSIEQRIAALRGWKRLLVAAIAGALSAFAFAPIHAAPILWLTCPLLLLLIRRAPFADDADDTHPLLAGFAAAWAFGFGFHLVGLHWIGHAFLVQADVFAWALPFAVTLMPAGLALFFGAAGLAIAATPATRLAPWASFVIALSVAEWLRSTVLTGFPWNVLGYAITWPLAPMQVLSLTGLFGATVLALTMAVLPAVMASRLRGRGVLGIAGSAATVLIPVAALFAYGTLRLADGPTPPVADVRLRIVQPSIDQTRKWRPDEQRAIFNEHLTLTRAGPADAPVGRANLTSAGITHVIWAEASMPFRPLEAPSALAELGDLLPPNVALVAGLLRTGDIPLDAASGAASARVVHNAVAAFDTNARVQALYDKIHLVPFGEYLPLPGVLSAMGLQTLVRARGGFTPGPRPRRAFAVPGLPALEMLICYEAIFPHEVGRISPRPAALFNLTNDGWFGTWSGPYQHFHQTRARAVEQGLPLVRASNNGISAVLDPYGRVTARLELNEIGAIDAALPQPIAAPVAAMNAIVIFFGLLLAVLVAGLATTGRRTGL